MCMIAYRPARPGKGAPNIPHEVVDLAMNRHPDGFGVAWRDIDAEGKPHLTVEKFGPSGRKQFRKVLRRVDRSGCEYVAHFRFATHGPKDRAHAHPFEYEDPDPTVGKVLVFHNGIIDISTQASESDTEVFVGSVLAGLPSRWWENAAMCWLVTEAIGWSKLTVMTATETVNLHDKRGDWDGGIWYSSSHKGYASSGSGTWVTDKDGRTIGYKSAPAEGGFRAKTVTADMVGRKDAKASAVILLPDSGKGKGRDEDDWDGDPDDFEVGEVIHDYGHGWRQFTHMGHTLSAIKQFSLTADGDYEDSVLCDSCATIGTTYVIDGTAWFDIGHRASDLLDEDGAAASLAEEYARGVAEAEAAATERHLRVMAN